MRAIHIEAGNIIAAVPTNIVEEQRGWQVGRPIWRHPDHG